MQCARVRDSRSIVLVRFFGKAPRRPSKDAGAPPEAATPAKAEATPEPDKKPARRRTTARPPRRDWAAEAAATPVETPAPKPTSLAASPAQTDDADATGTAPKRRRGTRGGRGRKKPGAAAATAPAEAPSTEPVPIRRPPAKRPATPLTIEEVVARQAEATEALARDVTTTLRGLQTAIAELRSSVTANVGASQPRVGIFVDVPNVIYAAERRNVNIDFGRVLDYFTRGRQLVRASAYAPISDDPQAKLESQRFVHHFVGHPYRIITKPLKRFADGSMKANFDIELAIDILTMSDRLDVVVLMSGDGDFRRLVEMISSRGVRVEVVAFGETASAELKSAADLYIEIGAHLEDFKASK
jgi:uncharacterized LabA/DUF88 family protein